LMAVLIFTDGKQTKYYLLGGIFVGLAINSKYTAFLSVAPLLITHYMRSRDTEELIDKNILLCLAVIPVAFLVTSPYVLLEFNRFMADLIYEARHYAAGHVGAESQTATSYFLYGKYLFTKGYGVIPIIFSGLGLIWLFRRDPWKAAVIAAFPLLLYLFVGRYRVFFPRNLVATLPFLSLLSGAFVCFTYKAAMEKLPLPSKAGRTIVVNIVLVMVLSGSVWQQTGFAVDHIEKITLPDTRWVSLKWVEKNLPPGSRIGREHYTPPIEKYTGKFDAVYLGFIVLVESPHAVRGLDYLILSSGDYGRYLWQKDRYPEEFRAYIDFFENNELIKEFIPDDENLGGPRISIYKMR